MWWTVYGVWRGVGGYLGAGGTTIGTRRACRSHGSTLLYWSSTTTSISVSLGYDVAKAWMRWRRIDRQQQMQNSSTTKPTTEPTMAPICSELSPGLVMIGTTGTVDVGLGGGGMAVGVGSLNPSPSVTNAVYVVAGRVIVCVMTRGSRTSIYKWVLIIAMELTFAVALYSTTR